MDTNPQTMTNDQQQNSGLAKLQSNINNVSNNMNQDQSSFDQQAIQVNTLGFLTPISPITYNVQVRSIEKIIHHFQGLTTGSEVIGIKTIDTVNINEGLFFGSVLITHADKSEILIDKISKGDARKVKSFLEGVVDFQRKNVVNMTGD